MTQQPKLIKRSTGIALGVAGLVVGAAAAYFYLVLAAAPTVARAVPPAYYCICGDRDGNGQKEWWYLDLVKRQYRAPVPGECPHPGGYNIPALCLN